MKYSMERELQRFQALLQASKLGDCRVARIVEYGVLLTPEDIDPEVNERLGKKSIGLVLMGLTHGNEVAGVAVLNGISEQIGAATLKPAYPLCLVLGNPWAAERNVRFLETDLNRSFAKSTPTSREEQRARELEDVLGRTAYILDFHQTTLPTGKSFFIFPFTRKSYEFARAIAPRQSIVTHWGAPFSKDGRCTDEFVNSKGGIGISMELGQNGFDEYQIHAGTTAARWAVETVQRQLTGRSDRRFELADGEQGDIYTWSEVIDWPEGEYAELEPGFTNFQHLGPGSIVARCAGRALCTQNGGYVIFPKYLTKDQFRRLTVPPTEMCRLMKIVSPHELPQ